MEMPNQIKSNQDTNTLRNTNTFWCLNKDPFSEMGTAPLTKN